MLKNKVKLKCLEKRRNAAGRITEYILVNEAGHQEAVEGDTLKIMIKQGLVEVSNLRLTSDNRLVDASNSSSNDAYKALMKMLKYLKIKTYSLNEEVYQRLTKDDAMMKATGLEMCDDRFYLVVAITNSRDNTIRLGTWNSERNILEISVTISVNEFGRAFDEFNRAVRLRNWHKVELLVNSSNDNNLVSHQLLRMVNAIGQLICSLVDAPILKDNEEVRDTVTDIAKRYFGLVELNEKSAEQIKKAMVGVIVDTDVKGNTTFTWVVEYKDDEGRRVALYKRVLGMMRNAELKDLRCLEQIYNTDKHNRGFNKYGNLYKKAE